MLLFSLVNASKYLLSFNILVLDREKLEPERTHTHTHTQARFTFSSSTLLFLFRSPLVLCFPGLIDEDIDPTVFSLPGTELRVTWDDSLVFAPESDRVVCPGSGGVCGDPSLGNADERREKLPTAMMRITKMRVIKRAALA